MGTAELDGTIPTNQNSSGGSKGRLARPFNREGRNRRYMKRQRTEMRRAKSELAQVTVCFGSEIALHWQCMGRGTSHGRVFCELAIADHKQKEATAQATEQRIARATVARTRRKLLEISV